MYFYSFYIALKDINIEMFDEKVILAEQLPVR